jgi:outer membrane protein assembly factor BamB
MEINMQLIRKINLSLTISIIILLIIGFFPSNVIAIEINKDDGTWTDSFEQAGTLKFDSFTSSCVRTTDGTIQLTTTSGGGRNYNFADGSNNHKAYYSQFFDIDHILFSFFSPIIPTTQGEYPFNENFQLPQIKKHDNIFTDPSSTQGVNNNVVHHFRMKLQGDTNDIGSLTIYWYGKAENATKIEMFYLNYGAIRRTWKLIDFTNNNDNISFVYDLNQAQLEQAFGTDNYIDICIVATKNSFGKPECKLYTDYVELKSILQKGYKIGYGHVETRDSINLSEITPNTYWELLTWDDFQTEGATVRYQILYDNGTAYVPIKNSILKGNEAGFTNSPVSLISLADKYIKIKIRANLSTDDSSITPKIFSWTVTWQSRNRWQDLFSSEYRIDVKNNVNVQNNVNISLISGDWPMFGQNPGNTRASIGKAAYTDNFYWWSDYHKNLRQTISSLVVDSNTLYVPVINRDTNNGSLYKYSPFVVDSYEIGHAYNYPIIPFSYINTNGNTIIGSPAISGRYVIVATGDANKSNYVYAFDKDNPSKIPIWTYGPSEPDICYRGSPIIAEGKIFLTSSSADQTNNKIIALDLSNGERKWNYTFPPSFYPLILPTWSFSTPAYSDGKIVVGYGCLNNRSDNLFAFESKNGNRLWNISIGAIGEASPVIYNDTVYIINEETIVPVIQKQTKVTAIDINKGNIKWETKLGQILTIIPDADLTDCLAQSTPAIANNVLYATSPDYNVTALDLSKNGIKLWSQKVYSKSLPPSNPILTSSPTYADGIVYVSTPEGYLYALNTSKKGDIIWRQQTFPYEQQIPISTDPIVTNGLVFFGAEDGRIYVYGDYKKPSEQISGSITSIPIQLPQGVGWNKFQAMVQTNPNTSINKITFSLLDANKTFIKFIQNGSVLSSDQTLGSTLRLHADFWAKNDSFNPKLLSWNITFNKTIDTKKPFINMSTLNPDLRGWVNEIIPQFTVKVKDNDSGLLVNSARYVLEYFENNKTVPKSFASQCQCTGVNGTTLVQQITINISKLAFFKNITSLHSLRINITDIAGNTATQYIPINEDKIKPSSFVNNQQSIKPRYNASTKFIWINASSFDNGTVASGIKEVQLYYRYSSTGIFNGNWINFAGSSKKSPTWKFNFTGKNQDGGYFEICTIATDNASNHESFPTKGDVSFLYDWTIPDLPSFTGDTVWFKEPSTFTVVFKDDFRLDAIQYHPNFDTSWTTIATNINASTYDTPWRLKEEYWDLMKEGEFYYLYFKINDTLGNTLLVTSNNQAITIRKDTSAPIGTIDIPSLDMGTSLSYNFTVSGFVNDQDGSGIKEVSLYYRFSKDKSNWSSWKVYGAILNTSPYEWKYSAVDGEGYYEFKIHATDIAGNAMESKVFPVAIISSFPMTLILVMISLVVVLCLLSTIIFIKCRKTKGT